MAIYIYNISQKFYHVSYDLKKVYTLVFVNLIAMLVFYISYYNAFRLSLTLKAAAVIIFS